ncbi:MAG: HD domain-containing protein [Alphaproteobacteria bacterium]|nr:HD domain-containing protein [Alphaproteobacteria bacterium]
MRQIVDFLQIAERLECEYRLTRMSDGAQQSVAAHSWNMALMAMVLRPYLVNNVDFEKVLKLCLLHDLPEAIAHDVPLHQQTDAVRVQKHADESVAVNQIVDMLRNDDIRACFAEYDARQSAESRLVKALDVMDTAVQHMCAQDLAYVGEYADNFYWKMFFDDEFAKMFDFEPVLRGVFDEIRQRVADRLKQELDINAGDFVK